MQPIPPVPVRALESSHFYFIFTLYNQCHSNRCVYHADDRGKRDCSWRWDWCNASAWGRIHSGVCTSASVSLRMWEMKRLKAREKGPTQPFCKRWLCSCHRYSSLCMSIFVHFPDRKFSRHELSASLMNICKDIYKYLNYFSCRFSTIYMLNPYLLKCWCSIKTVATCSTICCGFKMCCTNTHKLIYTLLKHIYIQKEGSNSARWD